MYCHLSTGENIAEGWRTGLTASIYSAAQDWLQTNCQLEKSFCPNKGRTSNRNPHRNAPLKIKVLLKLSIKQADPSISVDLAQTDQRPKPNVKPFHLA